MSTAAEYHCSPVTTVTTSIASIIASFIDILFFVLSNLLTSLSLSFSLWSEHRRISPPPRSPVPFSASLLRLITLELQSTAPHLLWLSLSNLLCSHHHTWCQTCSSTGFLYCFRISNWLEAFIVGLFSQGTSGSSAVPRNYFYCASSQVEISNYVYLDYYYYYDDDD